MWTTCLARIKARWPGVKAARDLLIALIITLSNHSKYLHNDSILYDPKSKGFVTGRGKREFGGVRRKGSICSKPERLTAGRVSSWEWGSHAAPHHRYLTTCWIRKTKVWPSGSFKVIANCARRGWGALFFNCKLPQRGPRHNPNCLKPAYGLITGYSRSSSSSFSFIRWHDRTQANTCR